MSLVQVHPPSAIFPVGSSLTLASISLTWCTCIVCRLRRLTTNVINITIISIAKVSTKTVESNGFSRLSPEQALCDSDQRIKEIQFFGKKWLRLNVGLLRFSVLLLFGVNQDICGVSKTTTELVHLTKQVCP